MVSNKCWYYSFDCWHKICYNKSRITKVVITKVVITKIVITKVMVTKIVVTKVVPTKVIYNKDCCWEGIIVLVIAKYYVLPSCGLVTIIYCNDNLIDFTFCYTCSNADTHQLSLFCCSLHFHTYIVAYNWIKRAEYF